MYVPLIEIVPQAALHYVIRVLEDGAKKYDMYGWRDNPRDWMTDISAAQRHMRRWLRGEAIDPESGLPALAHDITRTMFVLDNDLNKRGLDNRKEWELTP